jgi:hypothetical protein
VRKSRGFPAWNDAGPNIEGAECKYDRGKRVHNSGRPTFPKRHMESSASSTRRLMIAGRLANHSQQWQHLYDQLYCRSALPARATMHSAVFVRPDLGLQA